MMIISAREFRANQTKVLTAAREGQSIVLTSRIGNFKIVPINDDDRIVEQDIRAAHSEVMAHIAGEKSLPLAKDIVF